MSYEIFNRQACKRVFGGFKTKQEADNFLVLAAEHAGYEASELDTRPKPKRIKLATYTVANVLTTAGQNRQREKAFLLDSLGVVPYTVRTKENVKILLNIVNGYNHETGEIRLEPLEITDDGATLRLMSNNPNSYQGTWTVWLKCHDLRALINLGREVQQDIYDAHK